MRYHIGYYSGAAGDFLRALIVSGLKDTKTKFQDNKLYVRFPDCWEPVIEVYDNGKIQAIGQMDIDADRYRFIKLGHYIKLSPLIDSHLNQVGQYLKQCDNDVEKFQQFLFDYAEELAPEYSHCVSNTSISVGHEHIGFLHTFKGLKEFYTHIKDFRNIDVVVYININDKNEADQRWVNNDKKNDNVITSMAVYPDKVTEEEHFSDHLDISKAVEKYKTPQDLILPFKYIYKKEYLRKWIENNFDWRDWLFDEIYDAWYNKQTVIIDK